MAALRLTLLLTALTGLLYPLVGLLLARTLFPDRAAGSLLVRDGRVVGAGPIGQTFRNPGYFWGRPSALPPGPLRPSGGSNLGPRDPALAQAVAERIRALAAAGPVPDGPVPVDLVTASASGLDPHISPAAAYYQVPRVAWARGLDPAALRALVAAAVEGRQFWILGEPRVNVLGLNLRLDALAGGPPGHQH
ncbi:MAG: potassium-transporting ATPase subunit KdpC [Holophaga sp.]